MTYKKSEPSGQAVAQPWRSLTHIQIRNIHFLQSEALQSTTTGPNWPHRVLHKYYKTQQSHISPFQTLQKLQTSLGVTESFNNQHLFFIRAPQLCLQGCARSCGAQTDRQTDKHRAGYTCSHHSPGLCCFHKHSTLIVQDLSCRSMSSGVLPSLFPGFHNPREVRAEQCAHPACDVKPFVDTRQMGKGSCS